MNGEINTNGETEKITGFNNSLNDYNEIGVDGIPKNDNLTTADRKTKQINEENLKKEIAKFVRRAEDLDAILSLAARKVKDSEIRQAKEIDPEERNIVILKEALSFLREGNRINSDSHDDRIRKGNVKTEADELDSHIRSVK